MPGWTTLFNSLKRPIRQCGIVDTIRPHRVVRWWARSYDFRVKKRIWPQICSKSLLCSSKVRLKSPRLSFRKSRSQMPSDAIELWGHERTMQVVICTRLCVMLAPPGESSRDDEAAFKFRVCRENMCAASQPTWIWTKRAKRVLSTTITRECNSQPPWRCARVK